MRTKESSPEASLEEKLEAKYKYITSPRPSLLLTSQRILQPLTTQTKSTYSQGVATFSFARGAISSPSIPASLPATFRDNSTFSHNLAGSCISSKSRLIPTTTKVSNFRMMN